MVNFCTDPSDKYFFIFVQIMYTVQVCIMNNVPNDTKNSICLSVFKRMVRAFLMDNILHVKVALFLKWTLVFKTLCPYFFCYQKIQEITNEVYFVAGGQMSSCHFSLNGKGHGGKFPGVTISRLEFIRVENFKLECHMIWRITNIPYSLLGSVQTNDK